MVIDVIPNFRHEGCQTGAPIKAPPGWKGPHVGRDANVEWCGSLLQRSAAKRRIDMACMRIANAQNGKRSEAPSRAPAELALRGRWAVR